MDSAKSQIADKLKTSNNILVTVSRNPTVDQLAACLGLTLILNKLDKHVAAVFSGETPSTIEFLKPNETLEKTTDSLRDFIISLDKSKADKLRYKVEDDVVRIFITPYKTSISEQDFDFSQGDFNVDVVVAVGVSNQEDIDEAITAHGRILHDAVVTSINTSAEGGLGSINWHDPAVSSLSELVTDLGQAMGADLFDKQVSTALLTGIVAETDRFSNEKTSSETMRASAALMAAGADQQLVAAKLAEPVAEKAPELHIDKPFAEEKSEEPRGDGTIEIDHAHDAEQNDDSEPKEAIELPQPEESDEEEAPELTPEIITEQPKLEEKSEETPELIAPITGSMITEPPSMGGQLTANTVPEGLDPGIDALGVNTNTAPLLSRDTDSQPAPVSEMTPPPAEWMPPATETSPEAPEQSSQTLSDLEASVGAHSEAVAENLDDARDEVSKALNGSDEAPEAIEALNAQPLGSSLHQDPNLAPMDQPSVDADPTAVPPSTHIEPQNDLAHLNFSTDPGMPAGDSQPAVQDPNAPPSVPPPIPFQFGTRGGPPQS